MQNFDLFKQNALTITSLKTGRHNHILYGLIKWLRPKVVVEIGPYKGGSSVWLARALQENEEGFLYCIDDFSRNGASRDLLYENLLSCSVEEQVLILEGKSQEVNWPHKVDFAFIDGDHSYQAVAYDAKKSQDLGAYCLAFHDTVTLEGPRQFCEDFKKNNPSWENLSVPFDAGLVISLNASLVDKSNF